MESKPCVSAITYQTLENKECRIRLDASRLNRRTEPMRLRRSLSPTKKLLERNGEPRTNVGAAGRVLNQHDRSFLASFGVVLLQLRLFVFGVGG